MLELSLVKVAKTSQIFVSRLVSRLASPRFSLEFMNVSSASLDLYKALQR
jgi:hypoxanthine-guanine phosphoribosyltransferase